jgi:hypothetical protein
MRTHLIGKHGFYEVSPPAVVAQMTLANAFQRNVLNVNSAGIKVALAVCFNQALTFRTKQRSFFVAKDLCCCVKPLVCSGFWGSHGTQELTQGNPQPPRFFAGENESQVSQGSGDAMPRQLDKLQTPQNHELHSHP